MCLEGSREILRESCHSLPREDQCPETFGYFGVFLWEILNRECFVGDFPGTFGIEIGGPC